MKNTPFTFSCEHRIGSENPAICLWQSQQMNQIIKTTHIFCNSCPLEVYKYGKENPAFLRRCFNRRYGKEFVEKIHSKYQHNVKIHTPKDWNIIYENLKHLLNQEWCEDIGLTGSVIVSSVTSHKDYDIVFKVKNIEKYYYWSLNNTLPEYINNKKTDFYFVLQPHVQFFVSLWPLKQTVYINQYFNAEIAAEENLKVVYNNYIYDLVERERAKK